MVGVVLGLGFGGGGVEFGVGDIGLGFRREGSVL